MTDRHRVLADPHFANEQARCADARRWTATPRPRDALQETRDRGGQRKPELTIQLRGSQGVEFGQDRALPGLHRDVPLAQLVERHEALLVGVEQTAHSGLIAGRLGEAAARRSFDAVRWRPDPPISDERASRANTSLQTAASSSSARRRIVADGALADEMPCIDRNALAAGPLAGVAGVPSDRVAALGAHAKSLEQRRIGRFAWREAPILRPPPLRPREDGRLDDGLRATDPFLAGARGASGQASNPPRSRPVRLRRAGLPVPTVFRCPPHIGLGRRSPSPGGMARPDTFRVQPPRHRVHLETLARVRSTAARPRRFQAARRPRSFKRS